MSTKMFMTSWWNGLPNWLAASSPGDGFQEGVDIGPLVNARQLKWVASQVDDAAAKGRPDPVRWEAHRRERLLLRSHRPGDCDHEMEVMREETFGPVLAFMKVGDDLDQAFEYANDTIFGLELLLLQQGLPATATWLPSAWKPARSGSMISTAPSSRPHTAA